jgi:hypothetical protein
LVNKNIRCAADCTILIESWFSLLQETLGLGSLWSISFAGVIAKWLQCDPVKKGGYRGSVPYYVSLCSNECLVVNVSLRLCLDSMYFRSRLLEKYTVLQNTLVLKCKEVFGCHKFCSFGIYSIDKVFLEFRKPHLELFF